MIQRLAILFLLGASHCTHRSARVLESESEPVTTTPLGKYQGSIIKNSYDKPIYAFRGIRYAAPPVGELRFKPAVPVKKHEGIYDAQNDPPACPQAQLFNDPMSEDCLFLNVFTTKLPKGNEKVKRPVLVFIHPGDFEKYSARSNWAGPEYLLDYDIVLVVMNYRLGVLGFISTGDKEAPGNLGLKDQVEALKWVKHNIQYFGGDPNSVTIYGAASGGSCVNVHLVSPLSKGLFHKAIMSGGSFTGIYPIGKSLLKLTQEQAKLVGCPFNSTSSMVECLKKKPADKLGKSISRLNPFPDGLPVWRPVIEEDFGQERMLTDHPVKLMLEGKFHQVPILFGYNSDQYTNLPIELIQDSEELQKLDQHFDEIVPYLFAFNHDKRAKLISKRLREFYFGDKKIDNTSLPQLTDFYNDGIIGEEMHRAATLLAMKSKQPLFKYYFATRKELSHFNPKEGPVPKGAVLNDELIYILYTSTRFPKIERNDPLFQTVDRITCEIASLTLTGNASCSKYNVNWEPYNLSSKKYLEANNGQPIMKSKLHEKRFAEWDKLFPITKYDIIQDSSPEVNILCKSD